MARLRVGDIEIDGSNVSIGGVPQIPKAGAPSTGPGTALIVTPQQTALARPAASGDGLDGLAAFPIGHPVLLGAGAAVAVAGAVLLATVQAIAAAPLVFSGVGAMIVGLLKRRAMSRRAAARKRSEEHELGDHAARLRGLLVAGKPEQTVEWIAERSGLAEATVVRTLAYMRDRQELTEELNTETGDWYYGPVLALPSTPRDLDERLAALAQEDRKP